jgi:2',3'-cyclic-nucleotide 2'-phosphodiesterase (5'-nucleotidase family)
MTNRAGLREFLRHGALLLVFSYGFGWLTGLHPANADIVTITVLHTTDVRGHVLSLRHREWRRHLGGLLRCGTAVREVRGEGHPVLLIDCGNLLSGSPEGILSHGRLPLEAANWIGFDARVPAGQDWPLIGGDDSLERHTSIPLVAANVDVDSTAVHLRLNHRRWVKKELAGVRVAVVGLASPPDVPWTAADNPRLAWRPPDEAIRDVLQETRAWRADILVLAAHSGETLGVGDGVEAIGRLVRRFPEFDLVLCGGGPVARQYTIGRTLVAQAGGDGKWLGRVDVQVDRKQGAMVGLHSNPIEVNAGLEEDAALRQALGQRLGRIERALDDILGFTETPIGGAEPWPGQSALRSLLARGVREQVEADAVLWGGRDTGYLHQGEIRYEDILRAVPTEAEWSLIAIPAVELRQVLEENAEFLGTPDFLGLFGMTYAFVPGVSEPVQRLVLEDGTPPHGRRRLRIVVPTRFLRPDLQGRERLRAAAGEPEARWSRFTLDLPGLVARYVRRHSPLHVHTARGMICATERQ